MNYAYCRHYSSLVYNSIKNFQIFLAQHRMRQRRYHSQEHQQQQQQDVVPRNVEMMETEYLGRLSESPSKVTSSCSEESAGLAMASGRSSVESAAHYRADQLGLVFSIAIYPTFLLSLYIYNWYESSPRGYTADRFFSALDSFALI